jgi:hypothetical protein
MIAMAKQEAGAETSELGLVDLDGNFYPAEFGLHSKVAADILGCNDETDARLKLERFGWVFICMNFRMSGIRYEAYREPNDEQMRTCFDHAVKHNALRSYREFTNKFFCDVIL